MASWGSTGTAAGQLSHPDGFAIDKSGNIFVSDANNNRIQKFDASGVFVTMWGDPGPGQGEFDFPAGISVDSSGNVFVADIYNLRIQKFAPLPQVTGATLMGKDLTITGQSFQNSPVVLINDADESAFISSDSATSIVLHRKPKRLGLHAGSNTIQVTDQGHHGSNVFTLTL
jgi:DNA-binding beta-propeller fold protein YncE